jgi:antitoxin component YwqK of YwqJK toxin-antitoxin module
MYVNQGQAPTNSRKIKNMKYLLLAVFSLVHFYAFSQTSRVSVLYNSDSTVMGTGVLERNIQNGLWKFYNPKINIPIAEGSYKNGRRDGTWTSFYPNGKRRDIAEYRDGKLFGPAKYFDEAGYLKREMIL